MRLPDAEEFQKIYDALQDETSKKIYKHRLLYSLLGEREELKEMVETCASGGDVVRDLKDLEGRKVCYYGAGAGGLWMVRYNRNVPFLIDRYRTGTLKGLPILSLDAFLELPDCKEYLIIITVSKAEFRQEIAADLERHGLRYVFGFPNFQYFDLPELELKNECFADVGALDGETTEYFLSHFENGHAYVLEPNPEQFSVTAERLRDCPEVELFPYGAYDENTTLRFDTEEGNEGGAKVSESGGIEIEVRRLDDLLGGRKVTFLKMDIEGSELAALRGAERIIREQRPKLAICVYHKPEDMWEIPSLILQYDPDYKLYLRHYSLCDLETVLYAI